MKNNEKNNRDKNTEHFLVGLTLSGDGDLLHLSEGISNDLGYLYIDAENDL